MKKLFIYFVFAFLAIHGFSQNTLNPGDTMGIWAKINFDTTYNFIHIDTSSQNLWQVGVPQKPIFNASYSPSRAMVTDTINPYPATNHSWFDLYIGNFNYDGLYISDIFIDFKHKFDTDTLHDGGYITVSWDNGQHFTNVIHDTSYLYGMTPGWSYLVPFPELYTDADTLFNGEFGFSGSSGGWKHTTLAWHMIPVKQTFPPDTMIVRFNFISDAIDNPYEGWMIDDIRLFSLDLGSGINDFAKTENTFTISPNPFSDKAEIKFDKPYKSIRMELYNLQGKLLLEGNYSNCNLIELNCGTLPSGMFLLKATVDNHLVYTKRIIAKK